MSTTNVLEKPEVINRGGKFLTFGIGGEEYGLHILKVREIIGYQNITSVPYTPPYVKGVINLRGQVISVIDLRMRFGMPAVERTEQTCVIVVEINTCGRPVQIGIVVDRVSEVLHIPSANVQDVPNFGANIDTSFILGIANIQGRVSILLDIDRIMTCQEMANLEK